MPGTTTPPADGTQDPQAAAEAPKTGAPAATPEKTFTQADLDRIVTERLSRAVPPDYEALKTKAAQWDAEEDARKTEQQKLEERAAKAEALAQQALATANARIRRAEILQVATAMNAADADVIYALLAEAETITIDKDGNVSGVEEAVKQLLKDKPFLVKAPEGLPRKSGGEFGGQDPKSIKDKIKEAEAAGDWVAARRLKLTKLGG